MCFFSIWDELEISINKSCLSFLITVFINTLIDLILIVPDKIEEKFMRAIRTKNRLIVAGMQKENI